MKRTNRQSNPSSTIRHRRMDRHNHPHRQTKKLWPWLVMGIVLVILTCMILGSKAALGSWVQEVWHGIHGTTGQTSGTDSSQNLAGISPYGMEISNQYARAEAEEIRFGAGVFRGFNGRFNSVGEVHAATVAENSTAWWKAYKLMLGKTQQTLEADRAAEQALQDSSPWLVIHVNACQRGDKEIRRHLEQLDGVPENSYELIPIVRYKNHWVTRIVEVSEVEYKAANDNFQGWHPTADGKRVYRAPYGISGDRFFILEIFEDETKWARLVVHSYADPAVNLTGLSLGGVRHDDLSIVLPKEPCTGGQGGGPPAKPTPTPVPTAVPVTPTPRPTKEPKPANQGDYAYPAEKPPAQAPVGPATTEPPNAAVIPVTAAPAAVPTQAPTVAPAPTTAPTQVVVVIDNPPAPEPYPAQTPAVEPGLGAQPNDGVIADPEG